MISPLSEAAGDREKSRKASCVGPAGKAAVLAPGGPSSHAVSPWHVASGVNAYFYLIGNSETGRIENISESQARNVGASMKTYVSNTGVSEADMIYDQKPLHGPLIFVQGIEAVRKEEEANHWADGGKNGETSAVDVGHGGVHVRESDDKSRC